MNNYKIKLNNEAESREAQDLFEQLGFTWAGDYPENGDWYSHLYAEKSSCCHLPIYVWKGLGDKFQELTLPQLRDTVVLHRNDVKDATHVDPDGMKYIDLSGTWYWFNDEVTPELPKFGWHESASYREYDDRVLKPIQEQGLISGADAKLAWANGQDVQLRPKTPSETWEDLSGKHSLDIFDQVISYEFRLKPRTIKLSLEIPAPFEPKDGKEAWCLDGNTLNGYKKIIGDIFVDPGIGFWRTEEEIKSVVAALRGIKG